MKVLVHRSIPSLSNAPHLYWQSDVEGIVENTFKKSFRDLELEVSSNKQKKYADLHVFLEVLNQELDWINQLEGKKILICSEASSLCQDSQRVGLIFSRLWDRVFTWNRSFESDTLTHYDRVIDELKIRSDKVRDSNESLYFFYSSEGTLSLDPLKKLKKCTNDKIKPVDLCLDQADLRKEDLLRVKKIYYVNLSWHSGFYSRVSSMAQKEGIPFQKISWHSHDIRPTDTIDVVQEKLSNPVCTEQPARFLLPDVFSSYVQTVLISGTASSESREKATEDSKSVL
ncbi:MAG: hypothetical protein AB7F43_03135 [Bacteriovoracia bacterium]